MYGHFFHPQGAVGRSAAPNTQTVLSDVSDLSSVSSAPKYEADTVCSLAPDKSQGGYSTKVNNLGDCCSPT